MNEPKRPSVDNISRLDEILDLLADEVAARLRVRTQAEAEPYEPTPVKLPQEDALAQEIPALASLAAPTEPIAEPEIAEPFIAQTDDAPRAQAQQVQVPPITLPTSNNTLLLKRLALLVFALVVLINIPLNAEGVALARVFPNSASLTLEDGLLVKQSDSPDIYVYGNNAFHWITSLDAFTTYGYQWQNVHVVEPGYLTRYSKGDPIYVLYKCDESPHVYGYDGMQKHWIIDIPTFVAQGYIWEDVQMVGCPFLHDIPDGESIPPGHGTPPPPRP